MYQAEIGITGANFCRRYRWHRRYRNEGNASVAGVAETHNAITGIEK